MGLINKIMIVGLLLSGTMLQGMADDYESDCLCIAIPFGHWVDRTMGKAPIECIDDNELSQRKSLRNYMAAGGACGGAAIAGAITLLACGLNAAGGAIVIGGSVGLGPAGCYEDYLTDEEFRRATDAAEKERVGRKVKID